jgi:hypothetical protein
LYCIISPGASRASIRRRGRVLLSRKCRAPFSTCRSSSAGPSWSAKWSVAHGRLDTGIRPDVRALAPPIHP